MINSNNIINSSKNFSVESVINLSIYNNNSKSFLSNFIKDSDDLSSFDNKSLNKLKILSYSDKNLHFICRNCQKVPIINFIS